MQRAFESDPERSAAVMATLEPLEQEVLVRTLAQGYPDELSGLCDVLAEESAGRLACERMQQRPHLRLGDKAKVEAPGIVARAAPGPASRHPAVPEVMPPRKGVQKDVQGPVADCAGERACITDLAEAAAEQGQAQRLGAFCMAGFPDETQLREECTFRGAEAMAGAFRWRASQQVVALCAWSGSFAHGCLQHTIALMLPDVPPADAAGPGDVAESLEAVTALKGAVGSALAPEYEGMFWALWTLQAFVHTDRIDGRLLQVLPPEAWPHVRAAAAWRFLSKRPLEAPVDLDRWAADLGALLADPGLAHVAPRYPPEYGKGISFWPEDLGIGGEDTIPAAFCMGPGRRPVSADPRLDLELALLEASARVETPPPAEFYRVIVASDRDRLLRWTALRLLGARDPSLALPFDRPEESPLIRARARQPPA